MRVLLRPVGGSVTEWGVEGGAWAPPDGGDLLDLTAWWSLPGLVDAHAHLAQDEMVLEPGRPEEIRRRAFTTLEGGVFLCFDKGWSDHSVLSLSDRPPGERPDVEAAGRMIAAPGGYYSGFAIETDQAGLVEAVASEARVGWVKLIGDWPRRGLGAIANFTEDALHVAAEVAHAAGARIAIHTMVPDVPSMAVRAGFDSIEHGLFLTEDDVAELGRRGGAWVPTVLRMEAVVHGLGLERTGGRLVAEGLAMSRHLFSIAVQKGVRLLAGSDLAVPARAVAEEAIRLWELGLEAEHAVASVSTAGHAFARTSIGFLSGASADVVAFAADPLGDVTVLRTPVFVMRHGRVLMDRRPA